MQFEDLLIEIGCEELPSRYVESLSNTLFSALLKLIQEQGVEVKDSNIFATPRRLALSCKIAKNIPAKVVDKQGPLLSKCINTDNKPNAAGFGFAKSCGVEFSDLQQVEVDGQIRLKYQIKTLPTPVADKLVAWLNEACKQVRGVKMMRWHDFSVEFPRPVHWVMFRLGAKTLAGEVLSCQTQGFSYGHRFMHSGKIEINDLADYVELMEKAYVVAKPLARKQKIAKQIQAVIPKDCILVNDAKLLDEVTGLVEWPAALLCSFDSRYLQLPAELLIEVMRVHQKCFSLQFLADNKLAPYFITIANIESKNVARVKQGNQRVMTARLADAEFFFLADQKIKLATRVEQLASVSFHSALGSLLDKTIRVQSLAKQIAEQITAADLAVVDLVAKFAKADLCSKTVGEFPELHAVIGSELARLEGLSAQVVMGINQQVYPKFAEDKLPDTIEAQIVAVADRIDSLVGFFGAQCIPTGDKDPFGLRRAAMAVVRIVIEKQLPLDLEQMIQASQATYSGSVVLSNQNKQLLKFLLERFRVFWEMHYDTPQIFAAVVNDSGDFLTMYQQMLVLQKNIVTDAGQEFLQVNKRLVNFLKHNVQQDSIELDVHYLTADIEKQLLNELKQAEADFARQDNYQDKIQLLFQLTPVLNDLFENCLILAEDQNLRKNRLALLTKTNNLFKKLAKFDRLTKITAKI